MGALPKPGVPDGPVGVLFDRLHELHHIAGWPSLREMAREVGCSHTTISAAFSEAKVPRWGLLELVVETLGGDTGEFHALWLAASRASRPRAGNEPAAPVAHGASQPPQRPSQSTPSQSMPSQSTRSKSMPSQSPPAAPSAPAPPPRQLPADVASFTGRVAQLAELDRLLDAPRQAVAIAAVSGTAGVGKTALAVRWGHRAAHRFPDGQLYLNLRGYDRERPVPASQALEALLRELGVDGAAIPTDLPQRAARYRTLLAGRRMLILLDNAHSVEQVRDLLPGHPSCFVLVTSRESLPALVARHGAVRVNLDLLAADEAMALLRGLVGERVDAEPDAAIALAERCARLPLALRIAAELAAARPNTTLARLVAELDDEQLDLLDTGDDYTAVRTVFSWSYRHLGAAAAGAFRLLGLHPGRDLDERAAAALIGADPRAARRLLAELVRAHLLDELTPGRYGMHDLLRVYAGEEVARHPAPECEAARDRLFDHYLRAAAAAMDRVFSHNPQHRPRLPAPDAAPPEFPILTAAWAWLSAERRTLLARPPPAAPARPAHTRDLAATIAGYLDERARYDAALQLHELARDTAAAAGDRAGEGAALNHLAIVSRRLGRYQEAIAQHTSARVACRETGDRCGEARAIHGLGVLHWRLGRYAEAYHQLERGVALYREVADRVGEGSALYALGIAARRLGRYADAEAYHRNSIGILQQVGDRAGEAGARNNLGVVCTYLGRFAEAVAQLDRSLVIYREADDRLGQAVSLDNLGTACRRMGRWDDALARYREALGIFLDIGYRVGEAESLRGLGVTLSGQGRHDAALSHLEQAVHIGRALGEADVETGALTDLGAVQRAVGRAGDAMASCQAALRLAERSGDRYETARALDGIAALHQDAGDTDQARAEWERAYALFTALGLPDAARVGERLAAPAAAARNAG